MFVQLDQDTIVNAGKVVCIRRVADTDKYLDEHVLVVLEDASRFELDPEIKFEDVVEALSMTKGVSNGG